MVREFFNNRALFSDYYLKERRETPAWAKTRNRPIRTWSVSMRGR